MKSMAGLRHSACLRSKALALPAVCQPLRWDDLAVVYTVRCGCVLYIHSALLQALRRARGGLSRLRIPPACRNFRTTPSPRTTTLAFAFYRRLRWLRSVHFFAVILLHGRSVTKDIYSTPG